MELLQLWSQALINSRRWKIVIGSLCDIFIGINFIEKHNLQYKLEKMMNNSLGEYYLWN